MKKAGRMLLTLVLALSLSACGGKTGETTAADNTTAAGKESMGSGTVSAGGESSEIGEYDWILAIDAAEDTVTNLYAQKFAELVSEYSGGKMKIDVMANGVLGSDKQSMESIKSEDGVHFAVMTTANQVSFIPEIAVFDLPCPYPDIKSVRAAVDSPEFLKLVETAHKEHGYKLMGYADQMFRIMSANVKIEKLDDFSGIKIRTMENSNHMSFWKAIGANPTPMTFSEVYTSLQNHTIDAQENPYEVIVGNKFYEVQSYMIETNHIPHLLSLITADALYERLNDAEKKVLDQAAEEAKSWAREQADSRVAERIAIVEKNGSEIITLSAELYDEIVKAAQPVYDEIREQVGEELVDAYLSQK